MHKFYLEIIQRLAIGPDVTLLDVGCGSGVAAALAAARGARVSGLDATPELLEFAQKRAPDASFQQGDMEQLPYPDDTFDVVTGFNSFQYAVSPGNALAEARRVARPGGQVMIATWGRPQHVAVAAVLKSLAACMSPSSPGAPGPFALSEAGVLVDLVCQIGLQPLNEDRINDRWDFPDLDTTLRAMLSAGPVGLAIEQAGEEQVREAIVAAIAPFRTDSGCYLMDNEFMYVIARA